MNSNETTAKGPVHEKKVLCNIEANEFLGLKSNDKIDYNLCTHLVIHEGDLTDEGITVISNEFLGDGLKWTFLIQNFR